MGLKVDKELKAGIKSEEGTVLLCAKVSSDFSVVKGRFANRFRNGAYITLKNDADPNDLAVGVPGCDPVDLITLVMKAYGPPLHLDDPFVKLLWTPWPMAGIGPIVIVRGEQQGLQGGGGGGAPLLPLSPGTVNILLDGLDDLDDMDEGAMAGGGGGGGAGDIQGQGDSFDYAIAQVLGQQVSISISNSLTVPSQVFEEGGGGGAVPAAEGEGNVHEEEEDDVPDEEQEVELSAVADLQAPLEAEAGQQQLPVVALAPMFAAEVDPAPFSPLSPDGNDLVVGLDLLEEEAVVGGGGELGAGDVQEQVIIDQEEEDLFDVQILDS
jgi:hypothetical protein